MWYGNSHNTFLGIPGVPGIEDDQQKKSKTGESLVGNDLGQKMQIGFSLSLSEIGCQSLDLFISCTTLRVFVEMSLTLFSLSLS